MKIPGNGDVEFHDGRGRVFTFDHPGGVPIQPFEYEPNGELIGWTLVKTASNSWKYRTRPLFSGFRREILRSAGLRGVNEAVGSARVRSPQLRDRRRRGCALDGVR